MKTIYNEGRVVGLSQYEIYVRQLMSTNPEATPMTEREWLTNTLANNTSMILRIAAGTNRGVHDYVLPGNSNLCACTTVYGAMFPGHVKLDENNMWAVSVEDYGDAISNTEALHPEDPGYPEDVPYKEDPSEENVELIGRAMNFIKIRDMMVIQPGHWEDIDYPEDFDTYVHNIQGSYAPITDDSEPVAPASTTVATDEKPEDEEEVIPEEFDGHTIYWVETHDEQDRKIVVQNGVDNLLSATRDYRPKPEPEPEPTPEPEPEPEPGPVYRKQRYLDPNLNNKGFVRVLLTSKTDNDIYILLNGFVDKTMYRSEMSFQVGGTSNRPEDGDFLGPAMFPWACPVILTLTTDVEEAIRKEQAQINAEMKAATLVLNYRVLYLGTLHTVTWDTPLLTESGDVLLTEDGEYLMAEKTGTVSEMWQEEEEDQIVYYVPWWTDDEEQILTEDGEDIWAPKNGTITEMIIDGGIL